MAFYSGNGGSANISGNGITGVQSWSLTISKEVPETTSLGDAHKKFQTTTYSAEGTLEILMDAGMNSRQDLLIANSIADNTIDDVTLNVSSGDNIDLDHIIVTGIDFGVGASAVATMTVNFVSTGAISFNNLDS